MEFVSAFSVFILKMFFVYFSKIVEVVWAFEVDTFMNHKVFSVFDRDITSRTVAGGRNIAGNPPEYRPEGFVVALLVVGNEIFPVPFLLKSSHIFIRNLSYLSIAGIPCRLEHIAPKRAEWHSQNLSGRMERK